MTRDPSGPDDRICGKYHYFQFFMYDVIFQEYDF